MFSNLFGNKPTTRSDVALALTGAFFACFKAWDVSTKYKAERSAALNKENEK